MKKLINIVLLVTLIFIGFGLNSNFNYVDADAGQYNQSINLVNLVDNGDFSSGTTNWGSLVNATTSNNILFNDSYRIYQNIGIITGTDLLYLSGEMRYTEGTSFNLGIGFTNTLNSIILNPVIDAWYDMSIIDTQIKTSAILQIYSDTSSTKTEYKNIKVFNLTETYGLGNEPTLEEFEIILEDAPDYFDEWSYNYYEYDEYISDFSCLRYADNLIENGDFSTDSNSDGLADNWNIASGVSEHHITNEIQYFTPNAKYGGIVQLVSIIDTHIYYYSLDFYSNSVNNRIYFPNGSSLNTLGNQSFDFYSDIFLSDITYTGNIGIRDWNITDWVTLHMDNFMLFDLSAIYGKGNEPSQSEWELVLAENTVGYTDNFTFVDECWMEMEQTNPLYQYYSYIEGYNAEANLVFTETILEMDEIDPKYYIKKYDLDMNYLGVIGSGFVTTSSVNTEGYTEHTLDYTLPSPVVTEDGYIYLVYDKGGAGAKVIGGGYVFNEPSTNFLSGYTDDTIVVRTSDDAIGINDSPYIDVSDYQFDNDFDNYMFNDNDNFMITHFRINVTDYSNSNVSYLSENTDQHTIVDIDAVYEEFCDMSVNNVVPVDTYECYYYSSNDTELPSLLNYVDNNLTYSINLDSLIDVYNNSYINLLDDVGYADNLGVFSYGLRTNTTDLKIAVGETPLYHFNYFYEMGLVNHQIRNGRNAYVDIYKPYNYLDSVLTYQYLYDNNTSIYEFDINDNEDQNILMDVFDGLTPEDATITYYLKNVDGVYNNGASEDAYDIYISDSYVMTEADPFPDKVDNWMEMLNMDSTLGNILIASLILIMVTIGMYLKTKNVIAVLFVDFIVISLLAVLGIIPLWIILVLIMMFFGGLFIKKRGQE